MKRSVFWRGPNGTGDSGDWLVVFLRAVFSRASCVVAHYDGTNATAVPVVAWPASSTRVAPIEVQISVEGLRP